MAQVNPNYDSLCAAKPLPIAEIHPDIPDAASQVIDGVITITWPYSIVKKSIAFIVAEGDFRLRRNKGQIRVEFFGAAGKALANSQAGGGDEIRLSLDGSVWERYKQTQTKVPGEVHEWQLKFEHRLLLQIQRDGSETKEIIDVKETDAINEPENNVNQTPQDEQPIPSPAKAATPPRLSPSRSLPAKRLASSMFEPGEYASPAFLKRARVSYGSLFEDDFDTSDRAHEPSKKRSRFSLNATSWRYSSRSPTPEPENPVEVEDNTIKETAETAPEEAAATTPARPIMVDEGCQTQELDFRSSINVQVSAEPRRSSPPLRSSPTPATISHNQPNNHANGHTLHVFAQDANGGNLPGLVAGQRGDMGSHLNTGFGFHAGEHPRDAFHQVPPVGFAADPILDHLDPTAMEGLHDTNSGFVPALGHDINPHGMDIDPSLQYHGVPMPENSAFPALHPDLSQAPHGIFDVVSSAAPAAQSGWASVNADLFHGSVPTEHPLAESLSNRERSASSLRADDEGRDTRLSEQPDIADTEDVDELNETRQGTSSDNDSLKDGGEVAGEDYDLRNYDSAQQDDDEGSDVESSVNGSDANEAIEFRGRAGDDQEDSVSESQEDGAEFLESGQDDERERDVMANGYDAFSEGSPDYAYDESEDDDQGEYDDEEEEGEEEEPQGPPPGPSAPVVIDLLSDSEDEEDAAPPSHLGRFQYDGAHDEDDQADQRSSAHESGVEDESEVEESESVAGDAGTVEPSPKEVNEPMATDEHETTARAKDDMDDQQAKLESDKVKASQETVDEATPQDQEGNFTSQVPIAKEKSAPEALSPHASHAEVSIGESTKELEPPADAQLSDRMEVDSPEVPQKEAQKDVPGESKEDAEMQESLAESAEKPSTSDHPSDIVPSEPAVQKDKGQALGVQRQTSPPSDKGEAEPMPAVEEEQEEVFYTQVIREQQAGDKPLTQVVEVVEEVVTSVTVETEVQETPAQDVEMGDAPEEPHNVKQPTPEQANSSKPSEEQSLDASKDESPIPKESTPPLPHADTDAKDPAEKKTEESPAAVPAESKPKEAESGPQLLTPQMTQLSNLADMAHSTEHEEVQPEQVHATEEVEEPEKTEEPEEAQEPANTPKPEEIQEPEEVQELEEAQEPEKIGDPEETQESGQTQEEDEESTGPEDQIMSEYLEFTSQEPSKETPTAVESDQPQPPDTKSTQPKEPSPRVVVQSRRKSKGSDSEDGAHSDPSVALAKAAPVTPTSKRSKKATKVDSKSPIATIRVTRSKPESVDPSVSLAKAAATTPVRETRHTAHALNRAKTPDLGEALKSPSVAESPRSTSEADASSLKMQLMKKQRTSLPDCLSLKALRSSLGRMTDIVAVATMAPPQPHRPKNGPRDYMLEIVLTDPSVAPANVSVAHIFRPHQASLPVIHAGDVVLLRRFSVVAMKGRGFGVRASDAASWAVFEKGDEEMLPQIKGPPLEVLPEEVEFAGGLSSWWAALDDKVLARIDKATQKSSQAGKDDPK